MRVAVTGMGCRSVLGTSIEELKSSLDNATARAPVHPAFYLSTDLIFPAFFLEENPLGPTGYHLVNQCSEKITLKNLSRTSLLAVEAVAQALDDADQDVIELRGRRVGIAIGTTAGSTFNDESGYHAWKSENHLNKEVTQRYFGNNLAIALQYILGVTGPAVVVTNACSSGTDAIGMAARWIEHDLCDLAIAGGADELSRIAYHGFAALMLCSESVCRPFDKHRSGLNLGEGAGIFVLERDATVSRRRGTARGWVLGYGSAADGYHPTAPHPRGKGLSRALTEAIRDAGTPVDNISFVNAHGTGTSANDTAECFALERVGLINCPVVSTKSITGHTLGAAGGIEAVLTLLSLESGMCRGTIKCREVDPNLAVNIIKENETRQFSSRIGISQSLAFGGCNSALVLEST